MLLKMLILKMLILKMLILKITILKMKKVFTVDALNITIHIIADQSSGLPILIIP